MGMGIQHIATKQKAPGQNSFIRELIKVAIVSFLAMLELVRQKFCEAEQDCVFGEIKLAKACHQ